MAKNTKCTIPQEISSCGFVPHGPMDKASAYGAEDSRFDPWCGSHFWGHPTTVVYAMIAPYLRPDQQTNGTL